MFPAGPGAAFGGHGPRRRRSGDAAVLSYMRDSDSPVRRTSSGERLVVLVGLPGSGKSTWAARQAETAISSDEMRRLLADDPTDQTIHRRVFAAMRYMARVRHEVGRRTTLIDATNLSRRERRQWIALAGLLDCEAEAIFFDTPPEVCMARNRGRLRVVPEEAMADMIQRLDPPMIAEGFSRVFTLR